jgi:ketosteroid isomerase-like protein
MLALAGLNLAPPLYSQDHIRRACSLAGQAPWSTEDQGVRRARSPPTERDAGAELGFFEAEERKKMDNKAVLEAFLQAFLDGDLPRMGTYLADDVVLHEAAVLPYGGDHVGPQAFLGTMEAASSLFETEPLKWELMDAGDNVILHMLVRLTSRRTGGSFDIPVVEIFAFRDGKIIDDDVYYKDASLVANAA